ncbi:flagellar rod assembly protein/muramidase FlgJ, partial [mine drainage metagenome]
GPSVGSATHGIHQRHAHGHPAQFRAYGSCGQCLHDYATLLSGDPRYRAALGTGNDVGAFAAALQRGGYATDPNYARKLTAVADTLSRVLGAEPLKLAAAAPIAAGSGTL